MLLSCVDTFRSLASHRHTRSGRGNCLQTAIGFGDFVKILNPHETQESRVTLAIACGSGRRFDCNGGRSTLC
jgi:hypothetical protein